MHSSRLLRACETFEVTVLQGRVASEISTGDELVLTELVFTGFFKELPTTSLCAVLSCFVWQERSEVRMSMEHGVAVLRKRRFDVIVFHYTVAQQGSPSFGECIRWDKRRCKVLLLRLAYDFR